MVGESTPRTLARRYCCPRLVTPSDQVVELGNCEGWPAKLEDLNKEWRETVDDQ